jgi:DnaK suppressor protein
MTTRITTACASPRTGSLPYRASLLAEAADKRRAQLRALPAPTNPVAAAHRASVIRILQTILAAQARVEDDSYGACARCNRPIGYAALDSCPWTSTCPACNGR